MMFEDYPNSRMTAFGGLGLHTELEASMLQVRSESAWRDYLEG
jgi:hypothetical protein